jgi:hypothetical protein
VDLSHQLVEQLILLEQQAAQCAALLYDAPPEVLETVGRAFAPLPVLKGSSQATRDRWARTWFARVADCGDRWEARPMGAAAADATVE